MKTIYFFLLVLSISNLYSQREDCSKALDAGLKTYFTSNEYRDFKNWMTEYLESTEEERKDMKKTSRGSWWQKATTIVQGLPVLNQSNLSIEKANEDARFYRIHNIFSQSQYLSDEQFNEVISENMSDNMLEAYKACLDANRYSGGYGVNYYVGGDQADEFFIQVDFKSTPGGGSLQLSEDAQFSNMEPIRTLAFKKGDTIKDGQSRIQYFKRIDPYKKSVFSFSTAQPTRINPLEMEALPKTGDSKAIPIGTIVASILQYRAFLQANNLDHDIQDMSKVVWIPCDGRSLTVSKYASFSGGSVPDLRGVFLRGNNDYNISFPNVGRVSNERRNPDNNQSGEFQRDAIIKHDHQQRTTAATQTVSRISSAAGDFRQGQYDDPLRTLENSDGKEETRPKNVTVYYYIKIN